MRTCKIISQHIIISEHEQFNSIQYGHIDSFVDFEKVNNKEYIKKRMSRIGTRETTLIIDKFGNKYKTNLFVDDEKRWPLIVNFKK